MKKLFSIVVVLVLLLAMAAPAMAADLTVTHHANGHTYVAYQIFDGDLVESGEDVGVMSNISWGSAVMNDANNDGDYADAGDYDKSAAILAALKADETVIYNSDKTKYTTMKAEFASVNNVEGVVSKLTEWSSNSYRLDRFAEVVGQCLEGSVSKPSETTVTDNGDGTYTYRILGLDPGYYMIKDTTETVNGEDFETKYLLYLTTHIDLITKGDYSTVTKTVNDTIDGTYYDSIAEQLNKTYFYKWEIELDDEMAWYNTYKLECYDELSAGLDFGKYEEVYIEEADNNKVYLYKDNNWTSLAAAATTNSKTETSDGKTKLVLGWANLKTAYPDVAGDDKLVVKYSATLNENAVFGVEGNPNEVYIVFSNSPSDADDGQSESDDAVAFSFQLTVMG